jgi:hypothetical protein
LVLSLYQPKWPSQTTLILGWILTSEEKSTNQKHRAHHMYIVLSFFLHG